MRTTRSRIILSAVSAVVVILGIIAVRMTHTAPKGDDGTSQTRSSHPASTPGPVVAGYTSSDLFGDERFFFQYKNKSWEEANAPQYDGVRQIALTTHCNVMDRAAVCPRLTIIDERSNYYKKQFGGGPVVQTLERESCGLDGSKAGAFKPTATVKILGLPVTRYEQTLCGYGKYPVQIHRYLWFQESEGVLVILKGADNDKAMTDVAERDVADVEKSLRALQEQN